MRTIFLLFIGCWAASAQLIPNGPRLRLDPDVRVYQSNVVAASSTVSQSTLNALDVLVRGLKTDGVWMKIKFLAPFCGNDLTAARVLLKYPVGISSIMANSGSFVSGDYAETGTSGGLHGNATSKYLDSGYNPVTQSDSVSSFHLCAYVKGTETNGVSRMIMGTSSGITNITGLGWLNSGSAEYGMICATNATAAEYAGALTASEGFHGVTANGNRNQVYYYNGSASGSAVTATGAYDNWSFYIGCRQGPNVGSASLFTTRYLRIISVGTGLSATDMSNFYNRVQTFQTALSRNL